MTELRILSVLIPAVGGQGGGVLSEWIVDAALLDGYAVQSTSIPGVAQRTGATSYVIELTDRPQRELNGAEPVFSLFPVPGALDVLLVPEFLEVGRAIESGFASPSRTTIIASTHRLYSIHEKTTTGGSIYPREDIEAAAQAFSRRFIGFDALALARANGTEANAVLLGALAASEVLPISAQAFRTAIERKGVGVAANLKGFDLGIERVRHAGAHDGPGLATGVSTLSQDGAEPRLPSELADVCARYPEPLRATIGIALARLIDYQDRRYADRYLARLDHFIAGDRAPYTLSAEVARHLAVWMTYEDAIRVADLKTRATRFARIRASAAGAAHVAVTDYLKPDLDEIYGILPYRLVRSFAEWAERRWPHGRPTLGQHVKTTTISGFLRVWLLAKLRALRPLSYRAHHEHARMEEWLRAVTRSAALDYELACEVAKLAQLIKGYGDVRRRMTSVFTSLLSAAQAAAELDVVAAREMVAHCRALVLQGPEGEVEALRFAEAMVTRRKTSLEAAAV